MTLWRTSTRWTNQRRTPWRRRTPWTGRASGGPPGGPPGDPDGPWEDGVPGATWRWIVFLRKKVQALEREVDTGKNEVLSIARVAAGAQKELDIAKTEMVKKKSL